MNRAHVYRNEKKLARQELGFLRSSRRRASSTARTLLVAACTLAILLVAFSIYQHGQMESADRKNSRGGNTVTSSRGIRLPTSPSDVSQSDSSNPDSAPASRADVSTSAAKPAGDTIIGAGRNITMTIYPREGTKAQMELSVSDWAPKDGADHEFILRNPEVRMHTRDGNDVRVTAKEGLLDAQRKGPASLDPKRGRLSGDVVIEYDRRTAADKAALPAELRDKPAPGDLVRIELDEVQFDLEYDRLWAPGTVKLTARDAEFQAADVEIRFEHGSGRVDSMRIAHGGTITLFDRPEKLGLKMPGSESQKPTRSTISEWMRATLETQMLASAAAAHIDESGAPTKKHEQLTEEDGVPVFHVHDQSKKASAGEKEKEAVWYLAKFQGEVDAKQQLGDVTQSRLQADELEVLRDFGGKDKERAKSSAGNNGSAPAGVPGATKSLDKQEESKPAAPERVVLSWSGYMTLATVEPEGNAQLPRARVTATGNPARVSAPDGEAICDKLTYLPDAGEVAIDAEGDHSAILRSARQGAVRGKQVRLQQDEKSLNVKVTGPGTVEEMLAEESDESSEKEPKPGKSSIVFQGDLNAVGRREKNTNVDFTGTITQQQVRILDHAEFNGRTRLQSDNSSLEANRVLLTFGSHSGRKNGVTQSVERMHGFGDVVMETAKDRLECPDLDVTFTSDADGKSHPTQAIATGEIKALQGPRTLTANKKLIVDFDRVAMEKTAPTESINKKSTSTALANQPIEAAPSTTSHRSKPANSLIGAGGEKVVARRLRAFGDVSILDPGPNRPMELQAQELDCTLVAAKDIEKTDIEKAEVVGRPDNPANVRFDSRSVTGERIAFDAENQWADVPGAGRMTFLSTKDLDGKRLKDPSPIAITWKESMKFRGRENRATFVGDVHASSQSSMTFDSQQLLIEFDDATATPPKEPSNPVQAWVAEQSWSGLFGIRNQASTHRPQQFLGKDPAALHATGNVVAQRSEMDAKSGELESRSRISGPRMSLNLRSDVKKMLIEGAGNLQIEDFRAPASMPGNSLADRSQGDLFGTIGDSGPSKTLIEWKDLMWYDFSIEQTRFEGGVRLKHLSGKQLEKVFGTEAAPGKQLPPGRSTFLNCDVLTADFREEGKRTLAADGGRVGRLSSERMRQFDAAGSVTLQDQSEGLAVTGDHVTYERDQKILAISGTPQRFATIMTQKPGKMPSKIAVERLFYNLGTGDMQVYKPTVTSR